MWPLLAQDAPPSNTERLLVALLKKMDQVIAPAPTDLSPIEWVAVFLVGALVIIGAAHLLWRKPKGDADDRAARAQESAKIVTAINQLSTTIETRGREDRGAAERSTSRLHERMDAVEREVQAARRDISGLECASTTEVTQNVPPPRRRRDAAELRGAPRDGPAPAAG